MLGHDVHGDLGQIQVGAHARCGGDAGGLQNVQDDGPGQLPCRHLVGVQVVGDIHEHLVDGVGVDVLRSDIFQIHLIDSRTPINVVCHPGQSHDVVQGQRGVLPHLRVVPGCAGELPAGGALPPPGVDLLYPLHHLEQPGPAGDAIGFQWGRHSQADGLSCTAQVRYHKVGSHGVQAPFHALHTGVKTFEIAADIGSLLHAPVTPYLHLRIYFQSHFSTFVPVVLL